jgi:hypothetical protein
VIKTILFFCVALVTVVSLATAKSGYLTPLKTRYSIPNGSKLDNCTTCHDGQWSRNVYGGDLETAGIKNDINAAFAATDTVDSDGDGPNNQVELTTGTWPGDPGDIAPVYETSWGRIKALFE